MICSEDGILAVVEQGILLELDAFHLSRLNFLTMSFSFQSII